MYSKPSTFIERPSKDWITAISYFHGGHPHPSPTVYCLHMESSINREQVPPMRHHPLATYKTTILTHLLPTSENTHKTPTIISSILHIINPLQILPPCYYILSLCIILQRYISTHNNAPNQPPCRTTLVRHLMYIHLLIHCYVIKRKIHIVLVIIGFMPVL